MPVITYLSSLPLWLAALIVLGALGASAAALVFAVSVARELALQARDGARHLAGLLFKAGGASVKAAILAAHMLTFALWTAALVAGARPCRRLAAQARNAGKLLLMLNQYAKRGRDEFASFAEYRQAMQGESEDDPPRRDGPRVDDLPAYERALAVLGMTREEAKSFKDVRARYRALQQIVHPDKGIPTPVFSQMVNEALEIIRKEHGLA